MVRTCRCRTSLRLPGLPQVGHGAWLGAHFKGMVRTWGCFISMTYVFGGLGWGTISPSTQALTFAVKSSCGPAKRCRLQREVSENLRATLAWAVQQVTGME